MEKIGIGALDIDNNNGRALQQQRGAVIMNDTVLCCVVPLGALCAVYINIYTYLRRI